MDTNKIIDRLGGTTEVAKICGLTTGRISQWRHEGLPKSWEKFLRSAFPDVFKEADTETGDQP